MEEENEGALLLEDCNEVAEKAEGVGFFPKVLEGRFPV